MFPTLRDFVLALDAAGELQTVTAPVSPVLEIARITDLESKSPCPHPPSASAQRNDPRHHHLGGRALLFENVQGSDVPVLINAYGSYRRTELALGCHERLPGSPAPRAHTPGGFDAIADVIADLVKPQPPTSLAELLAAAKKFLPLWRIPPKRIKGLGLCQQHVLTGDQIDLRRWPLIRCWPLDGDFAALGYPAGVNEHVPGLHRGSEWDAQYRGRYITLAGIHTVHADDRDHPRPPSHNIGMYRVQLLGRDKLAMHWHVHHDGARHWRSWKALGQPMPVAIALGGPSVMPYAATAPLPPGISELLLAGFLNKSGVRLTRARTVPLWVPADAEIVIEGYVSHEAGHVNYDPRSGEPLGPGAVFEGPFGDHTGFYSLPDRYPVLTVTAITHRTDPIYPTTIVGLPPQEDYYLGKATERLFRPLLKTLIPDIEDYDLPMFGAFHNCAVLKIKKHYPLQARRVMHGVWGAGQMAWTKTLMVVDDDVDVHDTGAVLRAAAQRCCPMRDTEIVRGPLDILDHAAPYLGAGSKIGLDCTRKIPGEEHHGLGLGDPAPVLGLTDSLHGALMRIPGVLEARVLDDAPGWLLVRIDKQRGGDGARVIGAIEQLPAAVMPPYTLVLGADVELSNIDTALFHWPAHADASRDLYRWSTPDSRHHRAAFDCTPKLPGDERHGQPVRDWPPLLRMSKDVVKMVEARVCVAPMPARPAGR